MANFRCLECGNYLHPAKLHTKFSGWESSYKTYIFCRTVCLTAWLASYQKKNVKAGAKDNGINPHPKDGRSLPYALTPHGAGCENPSMRGINVKGDANHA